MFSLSKSTGSSVLVLVSLLVLGGCSGIKSEEKYPTGHNRASTGGDIYAEAPSIFGEGGLQLFGGKAGSDGDSMIGVNSWLWRASLDTVSFMPLASADPFGGTILTDWFTPPESPDERFKVNVFILGQQLRSDGVRVRVFRQTRAKGQWKDAQAPEGTARQIEDAILTRARQLRVGSLTE